MKHGKKATREQRMFIQSLGLDSLDWLVVKDTPTELVLVSRYNDQNTLTIPKDEGVFEIQ